MFQNRMKLSKSEFSYCVCASLSALLAWRTASLTIIRLDKLGILVCGKGKTRDRTMSGRTKAAGSVGGLTVAEGRMTMGFKTFTTHCFEAVNEFEGDDSDRLSHTMLDWLSSCWLLGREQESVMSSALYELYEDFLLCTSFISEILIFPSWDKGVTSGIA